MAIDGSCPDPRELAQFAVGDLLDGKVDAVCEHIVGCAHCTTILRELSHEPTVDSSISDSTKPCIDDPEDREAIERLIAQLRLSLPIQPTLDAIPLGSRLSASETTSKRKSPIDPNEFASRLLRRSDSPSELGWLGSYRIISVLGYGGMGVVFEAQDPELGRRVAVKAMLPDLLCRDEYKLRFLREARAAASIEHDYIVPIHQVGEQRGVPFFVMPLLKGESLDIRLSRDGRLSVREVVRIGNQIAIGLAAAHKCGLVHRDVKPANIWLEQKGDELPRVKILDFGLARLEEEESQLTHAGAIAGTPAFMAPEQARGEHSGARSDLFSLGCVLYFMATGKPPFSGRNSAAVLFAINNYHPPVPRDIDPSIPRQLEAIIERLLEKDPTLRFRSADDVAQSLQAIENAPSNPDLLALPDVPSIESESKAKQIVAANEITSRRYQSNSGMWIIGGILVALLMATSAWLITNWLIKVETAYGTVVLRADANDAEGAIVYVDERQVVTLRTKPDGEPISINVDPGTHNLKVTKAGFEIFTKEFSLRAGSKEEIHVSLEPNRLSARSDSTSSKTVQSPADFQLQAERGALSNPTLQGLVPRPVKAAGLRRWQVETLAPRGDIFAVTWSRDGRYIACGSPIGNIRIIDLETSTTRTIFSAHQGTVWAMEWSPTADQIVTAGDDGYVRLFDSNGLLLRELGSHEGSVRSIAYSRDGSWIASGGQDANIRLWRTSGEVGPVLSGHTSQIDGLTWHVSGSKLASASLDGTIRIWNLQGTWSQGGIQGTELKGHLGGVLGISWSADGQLLASAGVDGDVILWRSDGTQQAVISGHGNVVTAIAWCGSELIATSGEDKTVRLWQRDGVLFKSVSLEVGRINDLEWSRDLSRLAIATGDPTLRFLTKTGELENLGPSETSVIQTLAFNEKDELATGGDDGRIRIWNSDGTQRFSFQGHPSTVCSVSWRPSGNQLVSGSWNSSVCIWDTSGNKIAAHEGSSPAAWNPTKDLIAWASGSKVLLAETGSLPRELTSYGSQVVRLAWDPSGAKLASADLSGEIRIWDRVGKSESSMKADSMVMAAAWHPNQPLLAIGCTANGNIQIWNSDGSLTRSWNAHLKGVTAIDWSPDGKRLLSASYDQHVRVWNEEGQLLGELPGPMAMSCAIAWNKSNDRIATAHFNGTICYWDAATLEPLWTSLLFTNDRWVRFDSTGIANSSDPQLVDKLVLVSENDAGALNLQRVSELPPRQDP